MVFNVSIVCHINVVLVLALCLVLMLCLVLALCATLMLCLVLMFFLPLWVVSTGPEWFRLRSALNPKMLKPQEVKVFVPLIQAVVSDLLARLETLRVRSPDGTTVPDIAAELYKFGFEGQWATAVLRVRVEGQRATAVLWVRVITNTHSSALR